MALWLAGKDIENEALLEWDGKVVTVPSRGFQGSNIVEHIKTLATLIKVVRICRHKMKADRPDILLAMGSYGSIGPALAAHRLGIPIVVHEANVIPGRAINLLSRYADRVAISFEETSYYLKRKGVDVTGMPLRSELQSALREDAGSHAESDPFTLLLMGGSRGAHRLNEICSKALCALKGRNARIKVIHITGVQDEEIVRKEYCDAGIEHEVDAFRHDMKAVYREADLAVCRSGASTCAELNAFQVPALLVPYPYAVKQHQMANAKAMERRGCANVIAEADLNEDWLADYIGEGIADRGRLERMRRAAAQNKLHLGANALADLVEVVHQERKGVS